MPKKFNFQYRELPYWDEEGGENTTSRGADMLISMSKDIVPSCVVPVRAFERKREGEKVLFGNRFQSWGKKERNERNKHRVFGSHSSKRRKESGEGREWSGKKKGRIDADRVAAEFKKRGSSVPIADTIRAEFCEDGALQVAESVVPVAKSEERKEDGQSRPNPSDHPSEMDNDSKPNNVLDLVIRASKGGPADETPKQKSSSEIPAKVKAGTEDGATEISSKFDVSTTFHEEGNDVAKESFKEEDVSKAVHGLKQSKDESHFQGDLNEGSCPVVIDSENSRTVIENLSVPGTLSIPDTSELSDSNGAISLSSKQLKLDAEAEQVGVPDAEKTKLLSAPTNEILHDVNRTPHLRQISTGKSSEIFQEDETIMGTPDEHKSRDDKGELSSYKDSDKTTEGVETGVSEPKQHEQVVEESAGSSTAQGHSFESVLGSEVVDEATKFGETHLSQATPHVHKSVVGVCKDSSPSPAPIISRLPVSGSYKSPGTTTSSTAGKTILLSKQQRLKVSTSTTGRKDNASTVSSAENNMHEVSRHSVKSHPKDSDSPGSKSSQTSRIAAHSSESKHGLPGTKEQLLGPSSKASTAVNTTISSGSGVKIVSSQTQKASVQIKMVSSGSCQKNERVNQPVSQPLTKLLNHTVSMHPPASTNAATTLSDEELALLLHQELNSSPRVPRVPRMRQATGMQLASQTAPSMLSKRSSHAGGKDQVFKRKNKEEASRDRSRNSHEFIDETKKGGRVMFSPDRKYRESAFMTDGSTKKDSCNKCPDTVASMKMSLPSASTEGESSCEPYFEANGQNASSVRGSPRDAPNVDSSPTPCTLPGLIDEILSKGKCSTYEDLCNAVRPHWHNLRKPNGDRYAYSSHSHAVLDCLRNRSEWAHLIDRGPKNNSTKRRRKPDSDTPAVEESENEEAKKKASSREVEDKSVDSHREDFPKGKRKARKRRWLELHGQSVEVRKRKRSSSSQGGGVVSDDDNNDDDPAAAFSHSSNDGADGLFSEDESQGVGDRPVGAEVSTSTSSDDTN